MKVNSFVDTRQSIARSVRGALLAACIVGLSDGARAESFVDVGRQEPITVLINSSPWYAGFEAVVKLYEEQTGNSVNIDASPMGGMLEKARNAVRGGESPYDLLNLNSQWTSEFFEGGFLTPFTEIEANFELPKEVLDYGFSGYWNPDRRWHTKEGGTLYAFPPNGNVPLYFYRSDLLDKAGLAPPETWDDVLANCSKLQSLPDLYGAAFGGDRNSIRFDFLAVMLGFGGKIVQDPENGDYTVTVNSPEVRKALDLLIDLSGKCAPPNIGALGQADVIQLLATGRLLQGQVVSAAWANFEDPTKSAVVGKINAAPMPRPADGTHGVVLGNWNFAIPKNLPEARKKAALAFGKWFLSYDAQYEYALAGAIPVRSDVLASDLAQKPAFRWMPAYLKSMPHAKQVFGYVEGRAVEVVLELRLNQALIGELTSAEALNNAAKEIEEIFRQSGRKTGILPPLQ